MGIFGPDSTEQHEDGSHTDRYDDTHESVTYDKDGSVREHSYSQPALPMVDVGTIQVTEDGDGQIINAQWRND